MTQNVIREPDMSEQTKNKILYITRNGQPKRKTIAFFFCPRILLTHLATLGWV